MADLANVATIIKYGAIAAVVGLAGYGIYRVYKYIKEHNPLTMAKNAVQTISTNIKNTVVNAVQSKPFQSVWDSSALGTVSNTIRNLKDGQTAGVAITNAFKENPIANAVTNALKKIPPLPKIQFPSIFQRR